MHHSSNLIALKDLQGEMVPGHFRTPGGSISVVETHTMKQQRLERDRARAIEDRINKSEQDISTIKDMLSLILQKLEK
jgi:uncharacterized membrane protein YgaE (UPF0421/DUF939 family)